MDDKARSISFSRGKGKLTHTDRTFISPNVDPERTKDNVVLVNETLSEAYDKVFGEAQAEYNAKQKRKDRKIDDYFCKLFGVSADDKTATEVLKNDNKQQSFYEWVVGVGSSYDTALVDWVNDNGVSIQANPEAAQLAIECLTEYIAGNEEAGVPSYEERNPNFHLMKAIVHADEKTPHIHIDAVPFTDGYKKGMSRQQGIAKALEAMGYGTGESAIAEWQEAERKVFREICERHGFIIRDEEKSRGYTVLTQQYGEYHENELALEKQAQEMADNQKKLEQAKSDREAEVKAAEQARQQSAELQATIDDQTAEKDRLAEEIEGYKEGAAEAQAEHDRAVERVVQATQIPAPPKPPYPRKPTPPIAISRDEYIRNSVNRDLKRGERKKLEKEVGESYDKQMYEYAQRLALWEQWERDKAEWQATYGETVNVQAVAQRQAQTAKEQAAQAQALEERETTLKNAEEKLAKEQAQVVSERASMGAEIERRVQQALRKAQTFVEYGRTSARFNALFSKFIGHGESYDEARQRREQEKAHKPKSNQKGYGDI